MSSKPQPYLFGSFSSQDLELVDRVIDQLNDRGVSVWAAHRDLLPGEDWSDAIAQSLSAASGVLVFLSRASLRSPWAQREIAAAVGTRKRVFPIVVGNVDASTLPPEIVRLSASRVRDASDLDAVRSLADNIVKTLAEDSDWQAGRSLFDRKTTVEVASDISAELEDAHQQPATRDAGTNSVFVVHGHDSSFLAEVVDFLTAKNVEPVVLTRIGTDDQSLFQRFFRYGQRANFAIVLLSADDMGASRTQYESTGVGEKALQFRARQNVVLELGFFFGRLGWQNVFILQQPPERVYPNFERPSDLDGVVFNTVDAKGTWKAALVQRLKLANMQISN